LRRLAHALFVVAALALGGCRGPLGAAPPRTAYVEGAFAALPQLGVSAGGGAVLEHTEKGLFAVEGAGTYQFLSDDDLASDGRGTAGSFTQAHLGLKHSFLYQPRRHVTLRYGAMWFRMTGAPLIVEEPGDYYGLYVGLGFETDLSDHWTMGPEIRGAAVDRNGSGGRDFLAEFFWHVIFYF